MLLAWTFDTVARGPGLIEWHLMAKARANSTKGSPPPARQFHLFTYGTLMQPMVFRAVLGYRMVHRASEADGESSFLAREAVLPGYKKTSPDNTYLYAMPDPHGRIHGYVVGPLPGKCLTCLQRYEGKNYRRMRLKVQTADGPVRAVAFVGNLDELQHSFGYEFHDHLKQEVLLRGKIETALLEDETRRLKTDEETTRRALSELHGLTIRDLVRKHFDAGGISNFAIRQAISEDPLPDFGELVEDPAVCEVAPHYLSLVVRQVLFNQVEDRVRDDFRFELDQIRVSENFYERTISALVAFRILNRQRELLELLIGDVLTDLPFGSYRPIDYVRWAVVAARAIYDPALAHSAIRHVRDHISGGGIPLGVELEFSNIGHKVILDPGGRQYRDRQYDGFVYFRDFALDVLTWKVGGHVDDHYVKSSQRRRRGFFELALGSLSVEAEISKPITDDPWLVNQIIQEAMNFYHIAPHSVHISLQLRSGRAPVQDKPLPLAVMKCLFALAGDLARGENGRCILGRLCSEEIIRKKPDVHMLFSQTARRRSSDEEDYGPAGRGQWVQQFKFLRLSPRINYEPIIMALKGLQIRYNPGTFMTAAQYQDNAELRELFVELVHWGCLASPLKREEIEEFLDGVREGLMRESRGRPAHSQAYIAYCFSHLRTGLEEFNAALSPGKAGREARGHRRPGV